MKLTRKDYEEFAKLTFDVGIINPEAASYLQAALDGMFSRDSNFDTVRFNTACGYGTEYKSFDQYTATIESRIARNAEIITEPMRLRAVEILKELKRDYPITGLIMRMGGFVFQGENFPVVYDDDCVGTHKMRNFEEAFDPDYGFTAVGKTPRHEALVHELLQILMYCTDKQNVNVFDIIEKELV